MNDNERSNEWNIKSKAENWMAEASDFDIHASDFERIQRF